MRFDRSLCVCLSMLVLFSFPAWAQNRSIEVAAKVGVGFNSLSSLAEAVGDSTLDTGSRKGLILGGSVAGQLTDRVWLAPEVLFVQKGMNVSGGTLAIPDGGTIKLNEIEVPVLIQYRFASRTTTQPYLFAGPTFGFVTGAHASATVFGLDQSSDDVDVDEQVKSIETGLAFGAGLLGPHWLAEIRYSRGLSRINELTSDFAKDIHTSALALTAGVRF